MDIETQIRTFLVNNGVSKFWAESQMVHIRQCLSGNHHFISAVSNPKVIVEDGYIKVFQTDVIISIPRSSQVCKGKLIYRFNARSRMAHKVSLQRN